MTIQGIGIGFRYALAEALLEQRPEQIRWVEIHPENYMQRGGSYPALLKRCLDSWPVVTHGLSMGFGSTSPHCKDYLGSLRQLLQDVQTPWHTDHLCFPGAAGAHSHDLLPLPFTEESVQTAVARVKECRDVLGIELGVENVSYYVPEADPLTEATFLRTIAEQADASILLDVNNVYVNSVNHGFDAKAYIDQIPAERVLQLHVAGHLTREDSLIIDTHGEPVRAEVLELLEYTLEHTGPKPVLLERDNNVPDLDVLLEEIDQISVIYERATSSNEC